MTTRERTCQALSGPKQSGMNTEHAIEILRAAVDDAGSIAAWADQNGISRPYVSLVLRGRQEPGPKIAAALGLQQIRETTYRYEPTD